MIKTILSQAKEKITSYKLPVIPKCYYIELEEATEAIREMIKELEAKPISIKTLNIRVDTARDLVLKLYNTTTDMIKKARLAEEAILYGNRYRSGFEGLSNKLNLAEQLFLKGEYQKSLELSVTLLSKIEPGIYERLIQYKTNKGDV